MCFVRGSKKKKKSLGSSGSLAGIIIAETLWWFGFWPGGGPGLLGRADDAKFDAEMVVPEVALIGRTTKRADCDQENIIIII